MKILLGILSFLHIGVTLNGDSVSLVNGSFPTSAVGGVQYEYVLETKHLASGRGHNFRISVDYWSPWTERWEEWTSLPADRDWAYVADRARWVWKFGLSFHGNHLWQLRFRATVLESNGAWWDDILKYVNVSATGSFDVFADDASWDHTTAWSDNRLSWSYYNTGNAFAKNHYYAVWVNNTHWFTTQTYGGGAEPGYWISPNQRLDWWFNVDNHSRTTLPPGNHLLSIRPVVPGDTRPSNNNTSVQKNFGNRSNIRCQSVYPTLAHSFNTPTFGLSAINRGDRHGLDDWFIQVWSDNEQAWLGGQWVNINFLAPGGAQHLNAHLPGITLGQEWHFVAIWSKYSASWLGIENSADSWFWVEPSHSPTIVLTDRNTAAEGIRRATTSSAGAAPVLQMVQESYLRQAEVRTDFQGLHFTPGYPTWTSGESHLFSSTDGTPVATFRGSAHAAMWTQWSAGKWMDSYVRVWPKEKMGVTIGTDTFQAFLNNTNFVFESLGSGSKPISMSVNLSASSELVDRYNHPQVARKWTLSGLFALDVKAMPDLKTPQIPIWGPVAALFKVEVGRFLASVNVADLGYDPSKATPWSASFPVTGATTIRLAGVVGRDTCFGGIQIEGGGSAAVRFDGVLRPRSDGVYLEGNFVVGQVLADLQVNGYVSGACRFEVVQHFPVYDGATIPVGNDGRLKLYAFE